MIKIAHSRSKASENRLFVSIFKFDALVVLVDSSMNTIEDTVAKTGKIDPLPVFRVGAGGVPPPPPATPLSKTVCPYCILQFDGRFLCCLKVRRHFLRKLACQYFQ